ncbi:Hsp20/alpha crystallin family protein [Permianibacter sp. IMCC34836]|nr:Hsp20/alpha crystallin family protein [Permianibacter fluminis]
MRYQPWSVFDQLHREINQLFDTRAPKTGETANELYSSSWLPSVDVKDNGKEIVLLADLPGVEPDKIEVTATNGVLTLKGERQFSKESNEGDYHRIERNYGSFYRQFALPDTANTDEISAKANNGVLEIRIPKRSSSIQKRISISR